VKGKTMSDYEKCANCNKIGSSNKSTLPELSKVTFCSKECATEFTKKIEGGVSIKIHSDAGKGTCAFCGQKADGGGKRTGDSWDKNTSGKDFCCNSHFWAYSSIKELDVRKKHYSGAGSGTSATTGISKGLSFTPDLRMGRAVVDAAGFGLVGDAAGGLDKAGKWLKNKAEEEERKNREDAIKECEKNVEFINNFDITGCQNSKQAFSTYDELQSVFESIVYGTGYEDIDDQYENLIPVASAKSVASIAFLRGISGANTKEIDKRQLILQKLQIQSAKGKGKYAELTTVLNSVSFSGGEKLIQKKPKNTG